MIKTLEVIEAKSIEANEKMNLNDDKADYAFFSLNLLDWTICVGDKENLNTYNWKLKTYLLKMLIEY